MTTDSVYGKGRKSIIRSKPYLKHWVDGRGIQRRQIIIKQKLGKLQPKNFMKQASGQEWIK